MSISKTDTVPTWDEISATIEELFFYEFHNMPTADTRPVGRGLLRLVEALRTKPYTRITFDDLSQLMGDENGPAAESVVAHAVQYATGFPGLLAFAYELEPDGIRIEVPNKVVGEAFKTGIFHHPNGGVLEDWEGKTYIVFKPGPKLPTTIKNEMENLG